MKEEPVKCGCGGEAKVDCYLGDLDKNDLYYVYCPECNIQTANYLIEAEAITAWNRAMSAKEEDLKKAYDRGYAKAREDEAVSRRWDESYRASLRYGYPMDNGG